MFATGLEGVLPVITMPRQKWITEDICSQDDACYKRQSKLDCVTELTASGLQIQIMELYDTLNPSLNIYLRGQGISADEAEDVVQEAFLRLANHLVQKRDESNLRSWIFQVAHNLAMDVHRDESRHKLNSETSRDMECELVDPGSDPEQMYLHKEEMKRVKAAMARLTAQQRNSILLRAQGLRYGEIASVLGVSEQRAVALVKRALLYLMGGL